MTRCWIFLTCAAISFLPLCIRAQNIGINTSGSSPNASALLDVDASPGNNKGILIPRVALTAANNNAPIGAGIITSLLVYNTATAGTSPNNVVPGYYFWDGAKWCILQFSQTTTSNSNPPYFSTGSNTYISASASGNPGTGTSTVWVVPAGATQIKVFMVGGGGGSGYDGSSQQQDGANGGVVNGVIDVTPGESLTIYAGAGGTGYGSGGAASGKGGTGCYITGIRNAVTTLLCQAGGGGGASSGLWSGVGGGIAFSTTYPSNGGNGSAGSGGSGGSNYVGWMQNSISFHGIDDPANVRPEPGVYAGNFTAAYNAATIYGSGGYFGNGSRGVVIIQW